MGAGKVSAREGSRWLGLTIKRVRDLTDPQSDGLDRFLARSNGSRLSGRRGTTAFPLLVHESYIEIVNVICLECSSLPLRTADKCI